MKNLMITLVCVLGFSVSGFAAGTQYQNEIGASSSASLSAFDADVFNFNLGGSYSRTYSSMLQLGGALNFTLIAGGGTVALLDATVFPTLNFMGDLQNAVFVRTPVGARVVSGGGSSTGQFLFGVQAGKRFKVFERVSWTPNLFVKVGLNGNGGIVNWGAELISLSIFY